MWQDALLAPHMRPILEGVFGNLQSEAAAGGRSAAPPAMLKMCGHIINSILSTVP